MKTIVMLFKRHAVQSLLIAAGLCMSLTSSGQSTELTNFQLKFLDASDVQSAVLSQNSGTFILKNDSPNGGLSISAENSIQLLNDNAQGRLFMHENGHMTMGLSGQDFSGRFGKLGVYKDSDMDTAQLVLMETGDATDFTRMRFLNDQNLFDSNLDLVNWTLAAKLGDPDDYKFIMGLNSEARMRYTEATGEWEFLSGSAVNSRVIVDELELNGGSDFAEKFDITATSYHTIQAGYVMSIDPENAGKLTVSHEAYDTKVAGIISGANGIKPGMIMGQTGSIADGEYPIALSGRVYVATTAVNGKITPGDLLTTSTIAGHAMRATEREMAYGSIIGKAMTTADENGFVLVLVNLQ